MLNNIIYFIYVLFFCFLFLINIGLATLPTVTNIQAYFFRAQLFKASLA